MQIVGHRGAKGLATENTRASIEAALDAGVDWIEFDVRATRDGHVVLHHDRRLLRLAGRPYRLANLHYQFLSGLKLRGGQHITTLAEALNLIAGRTKVMIEIKSPGCAESVVANVRRMVKKGLRYHEFIVSSFVPSRLREIQALDENIPLALLQRVRPYRFLQVRGLALAMVGFYNRVAPARAIDRAHQHGLKTYVYTVNSVPRAQLFASRGVDAIATNRPDRLQALRDK